MSRQNTKKSRRAAATTPDTRSTGERVVQTLTSYGYRPTNGQSAFVIDFVKTYGSLAGHTTHVRVQFDKPVMGQSAEPILGSIIVTTQTVLPPTLDAAASAPDEAQEDLRDIIAEFSGGLPARSIDLRTCIRCGEVGAEYYLINDDAVCLPCVEERRGQ